LPHATLIVFILAFAAGLLGIIFFGELYRLSGRPYLRLGWLQLVIFNLILFVQLLFSYYQLNLIGPRDSPRLGILIAYIAVSTPLKPAWMLALGAMLLRLRGSPPSAPLRRGALAFLGMLLILDIGLSAQALRAGDLGALFRMQMLVEFLVVGGMLAIGALIVWPVAPDTGEQERRLARDYGLLILGSWMLIALSIMAGDRLWPGSQEIRIFLHALLLLLFNLASYVMFRRRLATLPAFGRGDEPDWEALALDYGVTAREREILDLICRGKRNQEIADELFVTLQTVKDHNYRLFKKLGVKTRVQAGNLVRGETGRGT
jgi:DNA-binding CsgD family transcriptional regulator